jgi:hypothetical protein
MLVGCNQMLVAVKTSCELRKRKRCMLDLRIEGLRHLTGTTDTVTQLAVAQLDNLLTGPSPSDSLHLTFNIHPSIFRPSHCF